MKEAQSPDLTGILGPISEKEEEGEAGTEAHAELSDSNDNN